MNYSTNHRRVPFAPIHRQIFLLIDNQRTPQELAHLTSRRLDEVYVILADMERIGLITL